MIARKLKMAQEEHGLTSRELAQLCNTSERNIERWRSGTKPRYTMLIKLSKALDKPVYWFLKE